MKRILITGKDSYIGTSFEKYISQNFSDGYSVDTFDMIDGSWKDKDFSKYDTVFHVAGIAHIKETKDNSELYYKVNRDLAKETASKAKAEGVKQFVFLSTMSVYGMETGVITKETVPCPKSNYGKSKLQAEEEISSLADDDFKICIIRPPMVYGEGCKGNYQTVVKIVEKSPIFPRVNNKRSLICIENLVAFVKLAVDNNLAGLFFPQNSEYMNTMKMAKDIALQKGKKLYFSYFCGLAVVIFRPFVSKLKKAFGNLIYENTEDFDFCYCEKKN